MKAKDLGVPSYDASVSCGAYCLGGSVNMQPTTYPEFTDANEVWVRGDDVAALAARLAEAERLLRGVARGGYPAGMAALLQDITQYFRASETVSGEGER
jgi:hypothetical protein